MKRKEVSPGTYVVTFSRRELDDSERRIALAQGMTLRQFRAKQRQEMAARHNMTLPQLRDCLRQWDA
jgi:hypothetical protein